MALPRISLYENLFIRQRGDIKTFGDNQNSFKGRNKSRIKSQVRKGNIYAAKLPSILEEEEHTSFDLFNKEGYFLHRVKTRPFMLFQLIIDKGNVYSVMLEEDMRGIKIKRYKIRNRDQLKEYSPPS